MTQPSHYPCRCCGYRTLTEPPPGTYEICPVCFWEDSLDEEAPWVGSNAVSLRVAQQNFEAHGVCEDDWREDVRPPTPAEARASDWAPVDVMEKRLTAQALSAAEAAFGHLRVGKGMRLYDAELADNYGAESDISRARQHDDYQRIDQVPQDAIARHYWALPFFNAPGFVFHVGAYMRWALGNLHTGDVGTSLDFTLYALDVPDTSDPLYQWSVTRAQAFDGPQCHAVVLFLELMTTQKDGDPDAARRALPWWRGRLEALGGPSDRR